VRVQYAPPAPNDRLFTGWQTCTWCRQRFRLIMPAEYVGPELAVLTCSGRCHARSVIGGDIPESAQRRRKPDLAMLRAAYAEYDETVRAGA
jgi:hypothetical protein